LSARRATLQEVAGESSFRRLRVVSSGLAALFLERHADEVQLVARLIERRAMFLGEQVDDDQ